MRYKLEETNVVSWPGGTFAEETKAATMKVTFTADLSYDENWKQSVINTHSEPLHKQRGRKQNFHSLCVLSLMACLDQLNI